MFGNERQVSGRTMMRSRSGASWYSQVTREWRLIILTAAATALFTTAGAYFATIRVENEKVRSENVRKIASDFQTQFSSVMADLQKFTAASVRDKKIPEQEKVTLASAILDIQLMMSPATGRWPDTVSNQAEHFFRDLADMDKIIRNATSFADLESLEKSIRLLVVDDLEIMRSMQKEAKIHYFPL
jgi:hypothetical protein